MQFVDPAVTKRKFDLEVSKLQKTIDYQRKRGIILLKIDYPNLYIAFCAPQLHPSPCVFAVKINFDNYDFHPLSVTFVNPFTFDPVMDINQLPTHFFRKIGILPTGAPQRQALLQGYTGTPPFICIAGVREYHDHPAHTGDSWFLHRKIGGEGDLGFLLDKLYLYGISNLNNYQPLLSVTVRAMQLSMDTDNIPE